MYDTTCKFASHIVQPRLCVRVSYTRNVREPINLRQRKIDKVGYEQGDINVEVCTSAEIDAAFVHLADQFI